MKSDGTVPQSAYLLPDAPLFDYPRGGPPVAAKGGLGPSVPMAIGAGVLLAGAAATYALAAGAHSDYLATTSLRELDPLRSKTNGLFFGAVGLGSAGLVLGGSAVIVGKW
ncbi:MAG: hypothetical protein R3F59_32440 [Myxococcota bacterium]